MKIRSELHRINRNSIRWPLMLAVSGNLLLGLVALGLVAFTWMQATEQQQWQARLSERTSIASRSARQYLEQQNDLLAAMDRLKAQPGDPTFSAWMAQNPAWIEIAHVDSNGAADAVASNAAALLQDSVLNQQAEWFQQATQGSPYLDIAVPAQPGTPYLLIASPSADGGVTVGRLETTQLEELAALQQGNLYLINQVDGQVFRSARLAAEVPASETAILQNIRQQPDQPWQGTIQNAQGTEVLAQAAPITGTTWSVVAEMDRRKATAQSLQMLPYGAAGLLLAWGVLTAISYAALDALLVRPLNAIVQGKDLSERKDELGQVSQRFERNAALMAQKEQIISIFRHQALLDSQFKTDFLARVSHDLRQPMGVILGFTEMLSEEIFGTINRQQRRAVEDIMISTRALSQMISDLLDTVRLESQTLHARKDEVCLDLLMRQTLSQVHLLAEHKQLELTTSIDPSLPQSLLGDANRLQQIVYNLVVNAIKFTQKGNITIRFYRFAEDQWVIGVSDTGQGIPENALEFVFEPFRQVSSQTTRDKGGVGLGLYIVQQLALLMGGQVQVESVVDRGSTFSVFLPLQTAIQKDDEPCSPPQTFNKP